MTKDLKIFLSSTKEDLVEIRNSIIKFMGVIKSDLISMEVFGSDETKPKDFCIAQVRKSNLFIGVYAERYGTIDNETELSITELEYQEAFKMLNEGLLIGLLIYIIDPKASWPLNLIDRDHKLIQKLKAFKEILTKRHTVTFFNSTDDLPFTILRDVIRKLGIGTQYIFQPKIKLKPIQKKYLERPIGMEYYTEDLIELFHGREEESNGLANQIIKHKMSLLIGSSGIGKTSLLNAGLFPLLHKLGWRTAIIRPLTDPMENLRLLLWNQLLEGCPIKNFDITTVVHSVATTYDPAHVLIVIDQFEDILSANAPQNIRNLTRVLLDIYLSAESNLRFLICYRADVEAQLGAIWQKVSGSAEGLPRLYLGPLSPQASKDVLKANFDALRISVCEINKKNYQRLITHMIQDLLGESLLNGFSGIYPPFLQMLISRVYSDGYLKKKYSELDYNAAGQCKKIIAEYLMNQLKFLGKNEQKARKILISLVSSYGIKTQKTVEEIIGETSLIKKEVEKVIKFLIDLRLVRAINDHFEIVHDFLAKTMITELISLEERESKKFKDLLASRAAAYADTHAILTRSEHLHIYKYKNKILCNEEEVRLLLSSHLAGNGPINYWLRSYPKEKIVAWIRPLTSEGDELTRLNAYRFLIKADEQMNLEEIAEQFSDYKLKSELGKFIRKFADHKDIPLLLRLYTKKAEEVIDASEEALINFITLSEEKILHHRFSRNKLAVFF